MAIRITWADPNSGVAQEDGFRVYRSTTPFEADDLPSVLATLPADATGYDDESVLDGITYYYRIAAYKGVTVAVSDQISITSSGVAVSYLLDDYPSSKPAFALNKLRSAYAGAAIRVRRASDNAEADIGFAAGALDAVALAAHCGASHGYVTKAYDQNTAVDFIQPTTSLQPKLFDSSTGVIVNEHGHPMMQSTEAGLQCLYASAGIYTNPNYLSLALAVKKAVTDDKGVLINAGSPWSRFAGTYENGSGTAPSANAGTSTHYVDGVAVSPHTRDGLHDALEPSGASDTVVMGIRTLAPGFWTKFNIMGYGGGGGYAPDALFSACVLWLDTDLTVGELQAASIALKAQVSS